MAQTASTASTDKKPTEDKDKCGRCDKTGWKSGALRCNVCKFWVHKQCTQLKADTFKAMLDMEEEVGYHGWACHSCGQGNKRLDEIVRNLESRLVSVEEKTKMVDDIRDKLHVVSDEVDNLKRCSKNNQSSDDVYYELELRKQKMGNLVIHNMPEFAGQNGTKKDLFEFDLGQVEMLCKEIDVTFYKHDDVKFIFRAGQRPTDGKPRPMIVGFRSQNCRDTILNFAYRTKKTRLQDVRIVPDQTRIERDLETKLQTECDNRNANLSEADAATFLWRVVGAKGSKRLIKGPPDPNRVAVGNRHMALNNPPAPVRPMIAQPMGLAQNTGIGTAQQYTNPGMQNNQGTTVQQVYHRQQVYVPQTQMTPMQTNSMCQPEYYAPMIGTPAPQILYNSTQVIESAQGIGSAQPDNQQLQYIPTQELVPTQQVQQQTTGYQHQQGAGGQRKRNRENGGQGSSPPTRYTRSNQGQRERPF